MKIAYADPPYPGMAAKHYRNHPDYDGEVDHVDLARRLHSYDGWVLHTGSVQLTHVIDCLREAGWADDDYRIMAWVKPFAAFKPNVAVAYAWEPVLVRPARKQRVDGRITMRDFVSHNILLRKGLAGAKPEGVCHWAFHMVGADPFTDDLDDLYPGTGAVTAAWETWRDDYETNTYEVKTRRGAK